MTKEKNYSELSSSKGMRLSDEDGNSETIRKILPEWTLRWTPRFSDEQWIQFGARSDEAWSPVLHGYDKERVKAVILSICPKATFLSPLD